MVPTKVIASIAEFPFSLTGSDRDIYEPGNILSLITTFKVVEHFKLLFFFFFFFTPDRVEMGEGFCTCVSVFLCVLEGGDGVKVCVIAILSVSESVREFLNDDF